MCLLLLRNLIILKQVSSYSPGVQYLENIWSDSMMESIRETFRESTISDMAADDIPASQYDNIGEAFPVGPDGRCPAEYTVNKQGDSCVFIGRIDVAKEYVKTGGISKQRKSIAGLYSAANPFISRVQNSERREMLAEIMAKSQVNDALKNTCEDGILKNVFMTMLVMLPGQTVPVHYDIPLFSDLTKANAPAWLQVAYALSGLNKEREIRQVQTITYLTGNASDSNQGGDFVYWPAGPQGPTKSIPVVSNSAIVTDGVHVAHAVKVWKPESSVDAPMLNKDDKNEIKYIGNEKWQIFINGKGEKVYEESELRMSFISRYICFRDEKEETAHTEQSGQKNANDVLSEMSVALDTDLVNGQNRKEARDSILTNYLQYPATGGFNYCVLPELVPGTAGSVLKFIFSYFC